MNLPDIFIIKCTDSAQLYNLYHQLFMLVNENLKLKEIKVPDSTQERYGLFYTGSEPSTERIKTLIENKTGIVLSEQIKRVAVQESELPV